MAKVKSIHLISSDWWAPHFETDLELIENSLEEGNEAVVISCKGILPTCMINPEHRWLDCVRCVGRTQNGLSDFNTKIRTIDLFNGQVPGGTKWLNQAVPSSLKEFVKLHEGPLEIGYAVATHLVDQTRDPEMNPALDQTNTRQLLDLTSNAYRWFGDLLNREKPAKVFAMNGRHLYYRAMYQACLDRGIPVFMHERGGSKDRYMLFENALPHSLLFWDRLIENYRITHTKEAIKEAGNAFYQNKAGGGELNWHSYTSDQDKSKLPDGFHFHRKKVGVFLSSEFEFAALSTEWDDKPYPDQNEGILRICKELDVPDMHFFIRAHPHMKNHANQHLKFLEENVPANATYIGPGAPVSSYAMLRQCDVVLSFGSTMGVEACYWGKPSIIAGPASYRSLNVGSRCSNHQNVLNALRGNWEIGDKEDAVLFGAVMATFGTLFKHVEMETPFKGTFKGKNVQVVREPWRRIALKMASLLP